MALDFSSLDNLPSIDEEQDNVSNLETLDNLPSIDEDTSSALNLESLDNLPAIGADEEDVEQGKISKLEYISNPEIMDKIRRFDKSKYGEEGGQQEGETNEEYFERFLTFKRAIEQNTIDQSGMIDWIRTASPEERDEFLDLYIDVENNLPNFYQEGGGNTGSAMLDYLFYTVSEPMNLIGGLFGKFFGKAATASVKQTLMKYGREAALKEAKKNRIKKRYENRCCN